MNLPRWQPTRTPGGDVVLFNGWIDNAADLATELGFSAKDHAALYGAAVERWSDAADCKIVGEYCAVIDRRSTNRVRLSRSPILAPPLH